LPLRNTDWYRYSAITVITSNTCYFFLYLILSAARNSPVPSKFFSLEKLNDAVTILRNETLVPYIEAVICTLSIDLCNSVHFFKIIYSTVYFLSQSVSKCKLCKFLWQVTEIDPDLEDDSYIAATSSKLRSHS
jgi:hypothetical protein